MIEERSMALTAPGPKRRFLTGNLREFSNERLAFLTNCRRDFGDIVSLDLGLRHVLLLNHPDYIDYVLTTHAEKFRKSYHYRLNELLFGNGLITSEGQFWLRQRRLTQPAFLRAHIASAYGPVMVERAQRIAAEWQTGETREIHAEMKQLILEIVAEALFGVDIRNEGASMRAAFEVVMRSFESRLESFFPIPEAIPTPDNLRLRQAIDELNDIVYRIIADRRRSRDPRDDVLTILLRAQDEDGSQMTDKQLRDEVVTLFQAGHETTAAALTWTWYLLSLHPEVERKVLAEVQSVLNGRPPTPADQPRLTYTECVIWEALRLYPPVYAISREATEDCEIGGYSVPAGTTVGMSQWVMHRDPRFFEDPEAFIPDRWLDGLAKRLPRYAYFPFGGGQRMCIGSSFALLEAVLVIATMLPAMHLSLVSQQAVVPWPTFLLQPKDGVTMRVMRRSS
jgi:cytochrome P450